MRKGRVVQNRMRTGRRLGNGDVQVKKEEKSRVRSDAGKESARDPDGMLDVAREAVAEAMLAKDRDASESVAEVGPRGKSIDLIGFVFLVLEKLWLVVLSAALGALIAGVCAQHTVPLYAATAKLYIANSETTSLNLTDLQLGTVLTLDYQEVFKTWEVHELVREELGLDYSYAQMQGMLTVTNPDDTRVLYLTVVHWDPQTASAMANAYARAAKTFITRSMHSEEPSDFSVALTPSTAINSGGVSAILKGFLLGTLLALCALFLVYLLDNRPKTPKDIAEAAGIPTLAVLPDAGTKRRRPAADESSAGKKGQVGA